MRYILLLEYYNDLQNDFFFLRKEPKYLDLFKRSWSAGTVTLGELEDLYDRMKKHKNTFKQEGIDISKLEIKHDEDIYETILDKIQIAELIEKFNKFSKLLPKHLRDVIRNDEKEAKKFKEAIIDFEYDYYKEFLKKVAKIKTTDELIKSIKKFLGSADSFKITKDIESEKDADLFYKDDRYVIALIYSNEASCNLGSPQWCISTPNNSMWDHYVQQKSGVQYFIWDFSKHSTDPESKIGITIYKDDFTAHDKNDSRYTNAMEQSWWDKLKDLSQLENERLMKYLEHNRSIEAFKYLNDESKKELIEKSPMYIGVAGDDLYSSKELRELIERKPKVLLHVGKDIVDQIKKEMGDDIIKYVIEAPELLLKNTSYKNIMNREQKIKYLCSYYKEDNYTQLEKYRLDIKQELFIEELQDTDFIIDVLNCNPAVIYYMQNLYLRDVKQRKLKLSYLVEVYKDNKKEWNEALSFLQDDVPIKNYFVGGQYKEYEDQDLYIFNARYVDKKVGTSDRGKDIFEKVLEIEQMLNYNPLTTSQDANGIKMRGNFQEDLNTYGLWTSKEMFAEEGEIYVDRDMYEGDPMMMDLIEENMFKI